VQNDDIKSKERDSCSLILDKLDKYLVTESVSIKIQLIYAVFGVKSHASIIIIVAISERANAQL